jgi:hypothetical protein
MIKLTVMQNAASDTLVFLAGTHGLSKRPFVERFAKLEVGASAAKVSFVHVRSPDLERHRAHGPV